MATIQKRGSSYRITVSSGYDIEGRQIRKSKTWKPAEKMTKRQIEKELQKQAALFERQVETGQFLDGSITLAEFIERWLKDYANKQLKAKSLSGYKDLLPIIIQELGHIKLAKLQPHHIQAFYNNLADGKMRRDIKYRPLKELREIAKSQGFTQKTLAEAAGVSLQCVRSCYSGKNVSKETFCKISAILGKNNLFEPIGHLDKLSDSTISKYHRVLSSILTTAVQWQVMPSNPCSRVKPPRVKYKEADVLDEEQVQTVINSLNSEPLKYKAIIMLILYSGLRRAEVCGLNWEDINFENNILHVKRNVIYTPATGVIEDTTKTKQSTRVLNIPPEMVRLLKKYRNEQLEQRLSLGSIWENSGKVFPNDKGGIMNPDSLSRWYNNFVKRHDLPKSHLHTLRHTSATLLIAGGVDIATVSKRLGHASKTTTLNIYTHAIQSADAIAAEKLQNMLSPSKRLRS